MRKTKIKKYKIDNYGNTELESMAVALKALQEVDDHSARRRVLTWLMERLWDDTRASK